LDLRKKSLAKGTLKNYLGSGFSHLSFVCVFYLFYFKQKFTILADLNFSLVDPELISDDF